MTPRYVFPGGSYPDSTASGDYVVLYHGSRLSTRYGDIPFPAGEAFGTMFNRIGPDGRRFAGLKHDGGGLAECVLGVWRDVPGPFAGSSPLIYDMNGTLIHDPIVYADGSVSSQGYRYIDERTNTPVSGQDTYSTPDGQINQFSVYRGVTFGQGHDGGLVVRGSDGVVRLLADGNPFDIRVQGVGPVVAVSFWDAQRDGLCAYVYIGTLAEYLALLPVAAAPPVITPIPPKPEPARMNLPANVKQIRDRFVAQYPVPQMPGPGPSDDAFENVCRAWCYKLAQTVVAITGDQRWGVKNAGGGRPQSKDTLALDGPALVVFDLLGGVGTGHPTLVADPQGEEVTGQAFMPVEPVNWLAGVQPNPAPQQPPSDPPHGPSDPVLALLAEIAALKLRVEALESRKFKIAVVPQ